MHDGFAHPTRRTVLRYGASGLATLAAGGLVLGGRAPHAYADVVAVGLFINAGLRTMVDGRSVFVIGFSSAPGRPELPGGVIEVEEGDTVQVVVTNTHSRPHAFAVPGVVDSGPIAPGDTRTVTFPAPARGTYFYRDPLRAPVNRSLGLYGALIVLPRGDRSRPITVPPDVSVPPVVQEYTWVLSDYDPTWGEQVRLGRPVDTASYVPEYFFINGLSGVLAVEDHNTELRGAVGDRTLLRLINVGLAPRSIHLHGNHFWILTHPDSPWLIGTFKDTVRIPSGTRVDVLVPFEAPPDAYPPVRRGQKYPVHDHIEMAETAHGGLYPAGMLSEFEFE